ncbi:MAG TPA: thiamine phosphate synthase [Polyangiaceae bacterium]
MRGLYVIVDLDALAMRGLDPEAFASAALAGAPCALQLRAKRSPPEITVAWLRTLKPLCAAAGVPLVANDRPDLAAVAGVDMIHVGQTDASPALARMLAPKLPLGISTHTPEQLNGALRAMPAYVAFGPVWRTTSKAMPDPEVGVAGLKQAARLVRHHARETGDAPPLVAIGGVTLDRVAEIAGIASAVAVISDLLPPPDLADDDAYAWVTVRVRHYAAAFVDPLRLSSASLPEIPREGR